MVEFKLKIPAGALANLRKQVETKLAVIVADVSVKTYNYILHSEFPYYSGSYISSWNISVGSPDRAFNTPVWQRGVYLAPREAHVVSLTSPYQTVYISNYAPHATQVEIQGTPKHIGGWYIATHARNNIVGRYKYF